MTQEGHGEHPPPFHMGVPPRNEQPLQPGNQVYHKLCVCRAQFCWFVFELTPLKFADFKQYTADLQV